MFRKDHNARAGQTGRASMTKSPATSSPSWKPGACPGPALGIGLGQGAARHAGECRDRAALFRRQCSDPLGRVIQHGFPGQAGSPSARRLRWRGNVRRRRTRHHRRLCRPFHPGGRETPGPRGRRGSAAIPFLKRFTVFNAAQCDSLPDDIAIVAIPPPPPGLIEPKVEALIRATGIDFRIGGDRAFYARHRLCAGSAAQAYFEPINWHRTALHELGHATGHPTA